MSRLSLSGDQKMSLLKTKNNHTSVYIYTYSYHPNKPSKSRIYPYIYIPSNINAMPCKTLPSHIPLAVWHVFTPLDSLDAHLMISRSIGGEIPQFLRVKSPYLVQKYLNRCSSSNRSTLGCHVQKPSITLLIMFSSFPDLDFSIYVEAAKTSMYII